MSRRHFQLFRPPFVIPPRCFNLRLLHASDADIAGFVALFFQQGEAGGVGGVERGEAGLGGLRDLFDVGGALVQPEPVVMCFQGSFFVRRDVLNRCAHRSGGFQQFQHPRGDSGAGADRLKGEVFFQADLAPAVDGIGMVTRRQTLCLGAQVANQGGRRFHGLGGLAGQGVGGGNEGQVAPVGGGGGVEGECEVRVVAFQPA